MNHNKGFILGAAILCVFFINSCTQSQLNQSAVATGKSQVIEENPVELVNQLDRDISDARIRQLNVLSPTNFKEAQDSFLKAKDYLAKGEEITDIKKNVAKSRASLKIAEEMSRVSRTTLPNAIKARDMARSAGATKFEKQYSELEYDFLNLTKAIENNNLRYAQNNQEKVVNQFRLLEVQAIKQATIGEVRTLIAKAENMGAKKIAPKSYLEAVNQLQAADDFITENPYAKDEMHAMAKKALFLANRCVVITMQSQRYENMSPEDIALEFENSILTVSNALGAQDMRDYNVNTQIENIVETISTIDQDRSFIAEKNRELVEDLRNLESRHQVELNDLNARIATLEGKTRTEQLAKEQVEQERRLAESRLEAERRFNKKYTEVQNYFTDTEAEVYKQENRLVLRLKSVNFSVGSSTIMPENYLLLSKVQKAIRNFDNPTVIIEGHTDSTGTVEYNQLLSEQRAEAVKEYLIANQTISADQLASVGYGSERPLASNATPEGRAINRRIDVIITPSTELY